MSTKSSPSKRDEKPSTSSAKKEEKSSKKESIMTRTQSTMLNTRQLRNKDSSRKKISEYTQLLMTPKRDRSKKDPQKVKKSPKEKKEKPEKKIKKDYVVKPSSVKTNEAKPEVPERKKDLKVYSRKRKASPMQSSSAPSPNKKLLVAWSRTAGELEALDSVELDDDDLLEILTCDSPVWWEDPPDHTYCEDALFTKTEEELHNEDMKKCNIKVDKTEELDARSISIPEQKQHDNQFMNKRSKLENVLGNIKTKFTGAPKTEDKVIDKEIVKNNTVNSDAAEIETELQKEEEFKAVVEENRVTEERKENTPSECSSSDDTFLGFQNDEILKDLENMDIPIENDESNNKNDETESQTSELQDENNEVTDEIYNENETNSVESNKSINKPDKKNLIELDEIEIMNSLGSSMHITEIPKSSVLKIDNDNFMENRSDKKDVIVVKDSFLESSEGTSCIGEGDNIKKIKSISAKSTESSLVKEKAIDEKKNIKSVLKKTVDDSMKIYVKDDSDVTSSNNDNNTTNNDNETSSGRNAQLPINKSKFTITSIEKDSSSPMSLPSNDTTDATSISSNQEPDTISDTNIRFIDDEENKPKTVEKVEVVNKNKDETDKMQFFLNNNNKTKDDTQETKPKIKINKEHLLAVYKTITDNEYRNNLKKNSGADVTSNVKDLIDKKTDINVSKKPKINDNESINEVDERIEQRSSEEDEKQSEEVTSEHKTNTKQDEDESLCQDCTQTEKSLQISDVRSVKYCLKCSSIFETATCSYCVQKSKVAAYSDNRKNSSSQTCKV